jgi:YVTN family beta-propeller protein
VGAVVWVATEEARTVTAVRVRPEPAVVSNHPVSGPAHNITVASDGTVAATLPNRGRIVLRRDGRITDVDLGGKPHDVKPAGHRFVVANEGAARLHIMSTEGRLQSEVALRRNPHDLAVTPDERSAWVSLNGTADLALVDLDSGRVDYRPTRLRPHDLIVGADGRVWVASWDGTVAALDASGTEVGRVEAGTEAHHMALTPGGEQLWVTDSPGQKVTVIDTATLAVVATLTLPGRPHHVAIAGGRAAVADNTNASVVVFDLVTRELVATVTVGSGPHGVAAEPSSASPG